MRRGIVFLALVGVVWFGSCGLVAWRATTRATPTTPTTPATTSTTFAVQHTDVETFGPAGPGAQRALERVDALVRWFNGIKWLNAIPRIALTRDWWALHRCEQGDTWYASGYNSADPGHQLFQGGLGMSTTAWGMGVRAARARGVWLPASALQATPHQQMEGAQAFFDATGGGGWACPA